LADLPVYINFGVQSHNNSISSQFHSQNLALEHELTDTLALVIIPNHDLVSWVSGVRSTANCTIRNHKQVSRIKSSDRINPVILTNGNQVTSKQHFHDTNSARAEHSSEGFTEWFDIEYGESILSGAREATAVLVEANVVDLVPRFFRYVHFLVNVVVTVIISTW
jgi:hypothetical protein